MPAERSDKGTTRVLPDTAIEEIYRLKREFPRLNATQIHEQLVRNGFITHAVSVCAVQRFIKRNDLKSARNPNMRDRKAFEEDAFGRMWQHDTCYFPYITEDGHSRRVYAVCIIDDHSRLIVGAGLIYDHIFDLSSVIQSPEDPDQMNPIFNSGDYLHFNASGGQAIADAFPREYLRS